MKKTKSKLWIILSVISFVFTVVFAVAIPITTLYEVQINNFLNVETQKIIPDPDAKIRFWTAYENEEKLVEEEKELCEQLEGEGAALLYNKDNALPLSRSSKLSCFSQSSVDLIYGGTGSGQGVF